MVILVKVYIWSKLGGALRLALFFPGGLGGGGGEAKSWGVETWGRAQKFCACGEHSN